MLIHPSPSRASLDLFQRYNATPLADFCWA
jgi:hypothetical protein